MHNPLILFIIMIVLITLMMEGTTMKAKMIIMMMVPNIKVMTIIKKSLTLKQ